MRVQRRVLEALAKAARAERASFPAGLHAAHPSAVTKQVAPPLCEWALWL